LIGIACVLFACPAIGLCQAPVIYPGGLVSAATFTTGGLTGDGIAPGSIATLLGANFATDIYIPDPLLFPTQLGGTSVTVGGIAAYFIYLSPNQINFQMPWEVSGPTEVVVTTPGGSSAPYRITAEDAFGVFAQGTAGCGAAAALNPASINSPSNSISPGGLLSLYGTGLFPLVPVPPDGMPAPSLPLGAYTGAPGSTTFDVNGPSSVNIWVGAAPGLVGVNQINVWVPQDAREGCAVPLLVSTGANGYSKPVTISIHRGGGFCSDSPEAGYGQIEWVKTVTQGAGTTGETDAVTISLQASPGKQKPSAPAFVKDAPPTILHQNFGPECPVPGYRSLDAGAITVHGPGLAATPALPAGLGPPESGQVAGLLEYRADLASGAIQAGSYSVAATGGADVGAFLSDVRIGAGINITTPLVPGTVLDRQVPFVVNWTGGDATAWVTLKLVVHYGTYDEYCVVAAPVSDGSVIMSPSGLSALPAGPVDIELDLESVKRKPLTAPGLSLGGEHTWKYVYTFEGVTLN
jgi:uncharacterized protein (TIGR03437 family)